MANRAPDLAAVAGSLADHTPVDWERSSPARARWRTGSGSTAFAPSAESSTPIATPATRSSIQRNATAPNSSDPAIGGGASRSSNTSAAGRLETSIAPAISGSIGTLP